MKKSSRKRFGMKLFLDLFLVLSLLAVLSLSGCGGGGGDSFPIGGGGTGGGAGDTGGGGSSIVVTGKTWNVSGRYSNCGPSGTASGTLTFSASNQLITGYTYSGQEWHHDCTVSNIGTQQSSLTHLSLYDPLSTGGVQSFCATLMDPRHQVTVTEFTANRFVCQFDDPFDGSTEIVTFSTAVASGNTLTVTKAGSGQGTVTSSPTGINCGSTCSASFTSGQSVTLTASAASGSTFAGWSGACSGSGTCPVTMSQASSVTATFNSTDGSIAIQNGVPVSGISGATGSQKHYTIIVPSGVSSLVISTSGGSGDVDLYVRRGSQASLSTYDRSSTNVGNSDTITINTPTAGTYYILLYGYSAYSGVTLSASYTSTLAPPSIFEIVGMIEH